MWEHELELEEATDEAASHEWNDLVDGVQNALEDWWNQVDTAYADSFSTTA